MYVGFSVAPEIPLTPLRCSGTHHFGSRAGYKSVAPAESREIGYYVRFIRWGSLSARCSYYSNARSIPRPITILPVLHFLPAPRFCFPCATFCLARLSRVANDLSLFDVGKYHLSVVPTNPDGELRFHIGEPITIAWRSPLEHSRRDWIGIYRVR